MRQLEVLPERLQLLPQVLRSRLSRDRVEDRVHGHADAHDTETLRLVALRTMLLDVIHQLDQPAGQSTGVAGEVRARSVSAGFARANHEHLNQLRQLLGEPEDDVHEHVREDSRDEGRQHAGLRADAQQVAQPVDRGDPGADAGVDDEEEERGQDADQRVDGDVVVVDVAELVSKHRLDFLVGHAALEKPLRRGDHSLAVNRTGREGVRKRVVRNVDRRLVLQAGLLPDPVDDGDEPGITRIVRVRGGALHDVQRDLRAVPPADDREERIGDPEAQLELEREIESPQGGENQTAHHEEASKGLQPRLETPTTDTRLLIMRNNAMT